MKIVTKKTTLAALVFIFGFCPQVFAQASVDVCSVYSKNINSITKRSTSQRATIKQLRAIKEEMTKSPAWSFWQQTLARELPNSDHAQTLLELGFQIRTVNGVLEMVVPESLLTPLENYNRRVLEMIDNGQLQSSEAIFAALLFEPVKAEKTKLKTFRPGIDEIPSAHHWKPYSSRGVISHDDWTELVARGYIPVIASELYMHDLAHITENLRIDLRTQRPEFMIAVRAIYKEQKKEIDTNPEPIPALEKRTFEILEHTSLGRLESEAKLKALRPELFGNQTSLEELKSTLEQLSFEELDTRLKYWIENQNQFVLQQGAVVRDLITERSQPDKLLDYLINSLHEPHSRAPGISLANYLRNANWLLDYILRIEQLLNRWTWAITPKSVAIKESSTYQFLLNELVEIRNMLDANPEKMKEIKTMIADQLARFEMGLVRSVELQLTPEQLVYDLAGAHVKPDSPSIEWLKSYLDPYGQRYSLYIDIP